VIEHYKRRKMRVFAKHYHENASHSDVATGFYRGSGDSAIVANGRVVANDGRTVVFVVEESPRFWDDGTVLNVHERSDANVATVTLCFECFNLISLIVISCFVFTSDDATIPNGRVFSDFDLTSDGGRRSDEGSDTDPWLAVHQWHKSLVLRVCT